MKWIPISIGFVIAVIFAIHYWFHWYIFEDGGRPEPWTEQAYNREWNEGLADYKCNEIQNPEIKDLDLTFSFTWPIVGFDGLFKLVDKGFKTEKSFQRVLYAGKFTRKISLKGLCFDPDKPRGRDMQLVLYFFSKRKMYAWSMSDPFPFLEYPEADLRTYYFENGSANMVKVSAQRN